MKFYTHKTTSIFVIDVSNFIRIPYSLYEMFNFFKLLSQISVTDTTYFLLTSSVVTGVTSVRVEKHIAKSVNDFFKSVNILQSYKQERSCLVHFVRLATTLLKDDESSQDNLRYQNI